MSRPSTFAYATPLPWFFRIEYSQRKVSGSTQSHSTLPLAGSVAITWRFSPATLISLPLT